MIVGGARVGMSVAPSVVLAAWARAFTRRGVRKGRRMLAGRSAPMRLLAGAAAPFSRLDLDIGGKPMTVEVVPWLTWFRSSVYYRCLSRGDLIEMSRRFSCKVRLRAVPLSGPPLPLAAYPGVLSDTTSDVLEWLINLGGDAE